MNPSLTCILAGVLACLPASADAIGSAVTLEIRANDRGPLRLYPAPGSADGPRAYAEAVKGAGYRLVVRNTLGCRVGLVIAVDGRNIISGAKSWLKNNERMYILGPGETQEYSGWRTGQDKVNQFYYGDNISKLSFPDLYNPTGDNQYSFSGLSGPYTSFNGQKRRVPIPVIRDDFNWQRGAHSLTMGGSFKFIKTNSNLINNFNFVSAGLQGSALSGGLDHTVRPSTSTSTPITWRSTTMTASLLPHWG